MIPIIHKLIMEGNTIVLGGDGAALQLLKNEFPQLSFLTIKDNHIQFKNGITLWALLNTAIKIIKRSFIEHYHLKRILQKHTIDVIISDNRYGLFSKKHKSIFVTHQLQLKLPSTLSSLEPISFHIIKRFIKNFNECWIPDFEGKDNLSGELSHIKKLSTPTLFIGPLSKFDVQNNYTIKKRYSIVAILSGSEPQRSILQKKLINLFQQTNHSCLLVEGRITKDPTIKAYNNMHIAAFLPTEKLLEVIKQSTLVICRSGYSSIMDLYCLNKNALLIPTPGQTEQEYLANHLKDKYYTCSEDQLDGTIIQNIIQEISLQ